MPLCAAGYLCAHVKEHDKVGADHWVQFQGLHLQIQRGHNTVKCPDRQVCDSKLSGGAGVKIAPQRTFQPFFRIDQTASPIFASKMSGQTTALFCLYIKSVSAGAPLPWGAAVI
jgi:hypothetical protein